MSLVNQPSVESLAQIELRYTQNLPFIDGQGDAVTLIGDCVATVTNVTPDQLDLSIRRRPEVIETEITEIETADVECQTEKPEPKTLKERAVHSLNKEFEDGQTPKNMMVKGFSSMALGGAVAGASRAFVYTDVASCIASNSTENAKCDNTYYGMLSTTAIGLGMNGAYNFGRGLYRWTTGTRLTANQETALDAVKDVATTSMANRITRRV